jgi:hypothetical protein
MKREHNLQEPQKQALNIPVVISRLSFHIHEDIEEAAKWYKIPLAMYSSYDIYIMQEDRCVFVGSGESAISWMKRNEGKVCLSRFPLNGL